MCSVHTADVQSVLGQAPLMEETLAAVGGEELAQLIAARYTEICFGRPITLSKTTSLWAHGIYVFPVDHVTDCNDFFLNATGDRPLPQDRGHRLYVADVREMRITGRIRNLILVPTHCMLADALTKSMISRQLICFLTSGIVRISNADKHSIVLRRLLRHTSSCTDKELLDLNSFETMGQALHGT